MNSGFLRYCFLGLVFLLSTPSFSQTCQWAGISEYFTALGEVTHGCNTYLSYDTERPPATYKLLHTTQQNSFGSRRGIWKLGPDGGIEKDIWYRIGNSKPYGGSPLLHLSPNGISHFVDVRGPDTLFIGTTQYLFPDTFTYKIWVEYDFDLNLLQIKPVYKSGGSGFSSLSQLPDNKGWFRNIGFGNDTFYFAYQKLFATPFSNNSLIRLDSNFNIVWEKKYPLLFDSSGKATDLSNEFCDEAGNIYLFVDYRRKDSFCILEKIAPDGLVVKSVPFMQINEQYQDDHTYVNSYRHNYYCKGYLFLPTYFQRPLIINKDTLFLTDSILTSCFLRMDTALNLRGYFRFSGSAYIWGMDFKNNKVFALGNFEKQLIVNQDTLVSSSNRDTSNPWNEVNSLFVMSFLIDDLSPTMIKHIPVDYGALYPTGISCIDSSLVILYEVLNQGKTSSHFLDNKHIIGGNKHNSHTGVIAKIGLRDITFSNTISTCNDTLRLLAANNNTNVNWFLNDTQYLGSGSRLPVKNKLPFGKSPVTVELQSGLCPFSYQDTVEYIDSEVKLSIGNDTTICKYDSLQLVTNVQGTYRWNTGDSTPHIYAKNPGTYMLKVIDTLGCRWADSMELAKFNYKQLELGADTLNFCPDSNKTILLQSKGYAEYHWLPFGETDSQIIVISGGTYSLQAKDANGCLGIDSVTIREKCSPLVFIPNSFTPDQNGLNDYFSPTSSFVDSIQMSIFNRWGELVFEDNNLNKGWDGTFKGGSVPDGTYVYVVTWWSDTHTSNPVYQTVSGKVMVFRRDK